MEDQSIEELCTAFDKIINSDNESVKRAFRHLLTLAELTDTHHDEDSALVELGIRTPGPFTNLLKRLDKLESEIQKVKKGESSNRYSGSYTMSGLDLNPIIPNSISITGLATADTISLTGLSGNMGSDTIVFIDDKP